MWKTSKTFSAFRLFLLSISSSRMMPCMEMILPQYCAVFGGLYSFVCLRARAVVGRWRFFWLLWTPLLHKTPFATNIPANGHLAMYTHNVVWCCFETRACPAQHNHLAEVCTRHNGERDGQGNLGFLSGRGPQFARLFQVKDSLGRSLCCFDVGSVVFAMETALFATKVCVFYAIIRWLLKRVCCA